MALVPWSTLGRSHFPDHCLKGPRGAPVRVLTVRSPFKKFQEGFDRESRGTVSFPTELGASPRKH